MNKVLRSKTLMKRNGRAGRSSGFSRRVEAIRSAVEPLENRLLLSSYLINLNTVSVNGGAATAVNTGDTITGTSGVDTFIVENTSVSFTIDGAGGADSITDYTYTTSANTLTVEDSGGGNEDTIIVRAPSATQADMTLNFATSIVTNGPATLNYQADTPSNVSLIGQLFSSGDNVIIDGTTGADNITLSSTSVRFVGFVPVISYSTFNSLTINGEGGSDIFTVNSDSISTSLYDGASGTPGSGTVNFNINANSVTLGLFGGTNSDTYTIASNSGPITITGGTGSNSLVIDANSSTINMTVGAASTNLYDVVANGGTFTLLEGTSTSNGLTVNANSGTLNITGSASGTDDYSIHSNTGSITLNGGAGTSTYEVTAPPVSAINIVGHSGASGVLTFTGTTVGDAFTITNTFINAGTQSNVNYSNLSGIVVTDAASSGTNTFLVQSDNTPTTINGSSGNDTFNIEANTALAPLTLHGNSGTNKLNIGSAVPSLTGNNLAGILGSINFTGSGNDILNLYDNGDATGRTFTLTATTITQSVTAAVITYSGLMALNLNLGNGGNTLNVQSTAANVLSTANLGTGANTVTVGSTAPTLGGVLDNLAGALTLVGSGADTLTVDDSGGDTDRNMTLNATTLTTVGLGTITYGGFNSLTIDLATPPPVVTPPYITNVFTVTTTNSTTPTTINGGDQNDAYTIDNDASALTINTGGGTDFVYILATGAATDINTQFGGTTVDTIGSLAPAGTGGVTSGIRGAITLAGGVDDSVTVDDSGDTTSNRIGALTANKITGLGMVAAGITYGGLYNLTINLGANGNTFTVSDTSAVTGTNINGGAGADVINVTTNTDPLNINTAGGNDTITVTNTASNLDINNGTGNDTVTIDDAGAPVTVTGAGGADVTNVLADAFASGITIDDSGDTGDSVNISSAAPGAGNIEGIAQDVTVTGSGTTTLTIDDSTDTAATVATLSGTALTFSTGGSSAPIDFSNLATLNLNLGTGGNDLLISNTSATTITNVSPGTGTNSLQVAATTLGSPLTITSTGHDSVIIGSSATVGSGVMTAIKAKVTLTGNGNDILFLDDGGDASGQTVDLFGAKYVNDAPNWAEVDFTSLAFLTGFLGGADGDSLTIDNTPSGATTAFTLGGGSVDFVTIDADAGPTTVTTGVGLTEVNILTTSAATTIHSNSSAIGDEIDVGSNAPTDTSSNLDSILGGPLTLDGNGFDSVYLYDDTSTIAKSNIVITGTQITGLAPVDIDYSDIDSFDIELGTKADTAKIDSSSSTTFDIIAPPTTAVADVFNVQEIHGDTTIAAGTGGDTVNVTSTAPTAGGNVLGIVADLDFQGTTGSILNIDNSGAAYGETDTINATDIVLGVNDVTYSDVPVINVYLSQGDDFLTISATEGLNPAANYFIDDEGGGDEVQVENISDNLSINTGNDTSGGEEIFISSTGAAGNGLVSTIADPITVTGHGSDSLTIDDSADTNPTTTNLSSSQVQTLLPTVTYTGLSDLTFNLGSGGNTFNVVSTASGTFTTVNTGTGTNTTNIGSLAPATTGGNVGNIAGEISISGQGTDTLNVDDSGNGLADTGSMTADTIMLAVVPIDYDGLTDLNIFLSDLGTTFAINNSSSGTNTVITGGPAADVFNVLDNDGAVTINTGLGNDTVNVSATDNSLTLDNAGGTDSFLFGSAANGDTLRTMQGVSTIIGAGSDILVMDDSGDTTGETVSLSDAVESGASVADIDYGGIGALTLLLGTGDDTLTISTTITGSTTVNAGIGDNNVTVVATQGPLSLTTGSGSDTILLETISNPTTVSTGDGDDTVHLETTNAPITITAGNGNDTLNLDTINGTALVTTGGGNDTFVLTTVNAATTVTAGNGNDSVQLDTINASTNVTVGNGTDTVNLQTANAATNITTGTGTDVVNITSTAPTAGGTLNNITAPVSIIAGGSTTANLDDTGSTTAKSLVLLAGTVSGLSPAAIAYSGLSNLNILLGSGVQTVTVHSTALNTTTVITAGSANDNFTLSGTSTTSLAAGLAGPITVDGALGTNALTVDDSTDTALANVVLTPTTISGIGSVITYLNFSSLAMTLGTDGNLTINGTPPGITLTVGGGSSAGFPVNLNYPGDFTGTLTLSNVNGGTIDIVGSLLGTMTLTGNLDTLDVGVNLSGTFSITGNLGTLDVGGNLSGSASVGGNLGTLDVIGNLSGLATIGGNLTTITVGGDLSGTTSVGGNLGGGTLGNLSGKLLVGGTIGTLTINNNLAGTLTAGGDVTALDVVGNLSGLFSSGGTVGTLTVGGNLSGSAAITGDLTTGTIGILSGTLDVGGEIGTLTINGADSGTLTAGSVGTISLPDATVTGAANNLFDLTENGDYRSIRAIPDAGANLSGLSANIFYEGSALVIPLAAGAGVDIPRSQTPDVGIRLTNSNPSQMFDLVLSSSGVSSFNLERVDSPSGAKTGLFNLGLNGSLLTTPDTATSSYFGYAASAPTVDLPADHLGLVSVSENMPSDSILANSIQGIAFANMTLPNGSTMLGMGLRTETNELFNVLAVNPTTKKPYAQVLAPGNQTLRVIVSPASSVPVGVFTGLAKKGTKFASNALYFTNQNSDLSGSLMADINFSAGARSHGHKVVSNLTFEGDGGSVNTWAVVNNITSDGWLGDTFLEGGYAKLQNITAPAIHGNVNLFGGKLLGQIQTTAQEIDPITGASTATSGDLGILANGASTIEHVSMTKGSSIVVRGNLVSKTLIDKGLLGTIAVSGDIDGDISIGSGNSSADIITLGNINGDISIGGNLSGRIAAKGNITGKVSIAGNITKTGGVISSGNIAKVSDDTQQGLIVAGGTVNSSNRKGATKTSATISNAANQSALNNIWTNDGNTLALDTSGTLDEAGLKLIQSDANKLSASNGTLSGTTP
jgi:hypothetical protein